MNGRRICTDGAHPSVQMCLPRPCTHPLHEEQGHPVPEDGVHLTRQPCVVGGGATLAWLKRVLPRVHRTGRGPPLRMQEHPPLSRRPLPRALELLGQPVEAFPSRQWQSGPTVATLIVSRCHR